MPAPTRPALVATITLLSALLFAGTAAAQVAPAESATVERAPRDRIERITNEDALTRIDELRVGGQTQRIDVTPKNGAPAYEVQPLPGGATAGETGGKPTGNAGRSSWRVLNF